MKKGKEHEAETTWTLEIHTRVEGYNSGKCYIIGHAQRDELQAWCDSLSELSQKCRNLELR